MGANSGKIQIWDSATCRVVRELQGHESRVGTMAWSSSLLASGSRDRNIYLQDIRLRGSGSGSGTGTGSGQGAFNIGLTSSRSGDSYAAEEYAQSLVSEIALARTQPFSESISRGVSSPQSYQQLGPTNTVAAAVTSSPVAVSTATFPSPRFPLSPVISPQLSAISSSAGPMLNHSVVRILSGHKQEVCGLKWSFDEKMLASG